jgi:Phage terminase large subunit/Terminase RNaseH-like domain
MTSGTSPSSSAGPTRPFKLTDDQARANELLAGPARHIMLRGGSRSGKTFLICRAIAIRSMRVDGASHAILRFRFNHLKTSIIADTWPKMMALCFPGAPYGLSKSDWVYEFPNHSRVWLGGLDDKDRTEKILGTEHSGIFLNECSQISYDARNKAVTRIAQNVGLPLRMWYDQNPPPMGHWTHRIFEKKIEPRSGEALANPAAYASMRLNPDGNRDNLPADYFAELDALPSRDRIRFRDGEYQTQVDNALWTIDLLDRHRLTLAQLPALRRIVIAIDPSGCHGPEDKRSDEVGIVACGCDDLGNGYLLEDATGHYSPDGWATVALRLFDRWQADRIIGEQNYGGAMVESTIRTARATAPVTLVTASRGKIQRAEPIAALYEQGKVFHMGAFPDLEDQLCNFSTAGFMGARSPDRADALIWGMTELLALPASTFTFGSA